MAVLRNVQHCRFTRKVSQPYEDFFPPNFKAALLIKHVSFAPSVPNQKLACVSLMIVEQVATGQVATRQVTTRQVTTDKVQHADKWPLIKCNMRTLCVCVYVCVYV